MNAAPPPLGQPFDEYARLLIAADDAGKRFHAAQMADDVDARQAAEIDREAAAEAVATYKHHHAAALMMFARWAAEVYGPGAVLAAIGLPADLAERLENVEAFVADAARETYA